MQHRKKYRSVPLSIAAPNSLLVKKVNETRAARNANTTQKERAVDAPPESSDDDSDGSGHARNGRDGRDGAKENAAKKEAEEDISDVSDESDDDDEPRGSIQSSTFGSSSRNSGKTTNRPASQSRQAGLLASMDRSRENSAANAGASTRGTKRGRDEDSRPAAAAASTAKAVDLSETSIEFGGRAKPRQGYGRNPSSSQGSQGQQGRAVFKPPPTELADDMPPHKASRRVGATAAKFKKSKYADSEDEAASTSTSKASTSTSTKTKPSFKVSKYSASSDEERARAKDKGKKDKPEKDKTKKPFMASNIYGRRKATTENDKPKEAAPRAVFKMPEFDSVALGPDVDIAALDEHLLELASLSQEKAKADDTPPQPVCPLCKTAVDDETIEALLQPGHYLLRTKKSGVVKLSQLKFDEKVMFCAGHKQRTSRHAWKARGYPSIDWAALPARLEAHYAHVKGVLLLRESTYRTAYESRKTATKTNTIDALVPGYYGRRGQQVLSAAIIQQLSDVLRQQAVEDTVVAARGMVAYVQAVLVPELAVQLIREDMGGLGKISAAEGRQILADSAVIGEEVMEEERDVVAEESDEGESSVYGDGPYDSD